MPDKSWKEAERRASEFFGSSRQRTGPTGRDQPDFPHEWMAPEVKYRKSVPAWVEDYVSQAEHNAPAGLVPVVILVPHRTPIEDAFVIMRAGTFRDLMEEP